MPFGIVQVARYALLGAGALLTLSGTRDYLDSRIGQARAARSLAGPRATAAEVPPRLGESVARLTIPRLSAELYVVEGDGSRELRLGPGHLQGTALPGENGNCVIAGHRDTHFRVLKDVRGGDEIVLETGAGRFVYRVSKLEIVSPGNTGALRPTRAAELNLITCYPFQYFGPAPRRFVVTARLEHSAPARSTM
jgi:LPXTG-site transpeptidase (sortase) family protein